METIHRIVLAIILIYSIGIFKGLSKGQLVQKKPASVDDRIKEVRSILLSVEDIRNEVGELREYLSEKYAESVAESVSNCTTQ